MGKSFSFRPERLNLLGKGGGEPTNWRTAQLGALGSLLGHWSLPNPAPALVCLPTGTGKSAVATAAPFIARAMRVLVVVPTVELRKQMTSEFGTLQDLQDVGAYTSTEELPSATALVGVQHDWSQLRQHDVVVSIPQAISPVSYDEGSGPPVDLFDLLIFDEAHHVPAKTWLAILDHFEKAKKLLLTATPIRRDRKRLPGAIVFNYPLKQAIADNIYKPIEPFIIQPEGGRSDAAFFDAKIVDKVVDLLSTPEHQKSAALVRAKSIARARELQSLYEAKSIEIAILHSKQNKETQNTVISQLRDGEIRVVVAVGMLTEGFNLPSARILAYHDKYQTMPATVQLVGRLARVHADHPQASVLVTGKDNHLYPKLEEAVNQLIDEDADWRQLLPGLLDRQLENVQSELDYNKKLEVSVTGPLDASMMFPVKRAEIVEVKEPNWKPDFNGKLARALDVGTRYHGREIIYRAIGDDGKTLVLVSSETVKTKWSPSPMLASTQYYLTIVSFVPAREADTPALMLLNADCSYLAKRFLKSLEGQATTSPASPTALQAMLDSFERVSASSIGLKNAQGNIDGQPSYKQNLGRAVEHGVPERDLQESFFGHAMIQTRDSQGSTHTSGISAKKNKFWETTRTTLRLHREFVEDLAERYWYPSVSTAGPLLPSLSRGKAMNGWPDAAIVYADMHRSFFLGGWRLFVQGEDRGGLEGLNLKARRRDSENLEIEGYLIRADESEEIVWKGMAKPSGEIVEQQTETVTFVQRGHGKPRVLSELFSEKSPTIYFSNGQVAEAPVVYEKTTIAPFDDQCLRPLPFTGVNIEKETSRSTKVGDAIHTAVEEHLAARPVRGRRRWILRNDGSGEIADHLLIELQDDGVLLELWHSKAANGSAPAVRATDFEHVVAQAIKSRRWANSLDIWNEVGMRLVGARAPLAEVVGGNKELLQAFCGQRKSRLSLSWTRSRPIVKTSIVIVQPGLSRKKMIDEYASRSDAAVQISELLAVFLDLTKSLGGKSEVVCSV